MSRFAIVLVAALSGASLLGLITVTLFPFVLVLIAQVFGHVTGSARSLAMTPSRIGSVLDWATKQDVKRGSVRSVRMPPGLFALGIGAPVEIAYLEDGRHCFLVKTEIGYKDNFEGVLSCTGPLRRSEIIGARGAYPSYISLTRCSLPGCGVFEELYIRRARDERTFDVYFDLN